MDLMKLLQAPGTVMLDTSAGSNSRCLVFTDPERTLTASRPEHVPSLLRALDDAVANGRHAAGYLSYESGYGLEPDRFADQSDVDYSDMLGYPLAWFGLYRAPVEITSDDVARALSSVEAREASIDLSLDESEAAYESKIDKIKRLIRDGDVYQINFTGRFEGSFDHGAASLYAMMRQRQPVAFGAFIQLGSAQLLSASPERFIEWQGDSIEARPMKGTAPRGATPETDAMLAEWLRTDPKSQAENLMIVDLLRNDLSVVCEPGSVRVPSLFEVETYATLLQMTSTVSGRLTPLRKPSDLLTALFPCGSVTGAPKIRAMRRILELESKPRGIYCGAIGHVTPSGSGTFNVAIRTLSLRSEKVTLGSGGGIVWDSDPSAEYRECLLKSHFMTTEGRSEQSEIEIIETMRWENGIALLDRHLDRLTRTAERLNYACPSGEIKSGLLDLGTEWADSGVVVVRLLLGPTGRFRIETKRLDSPPKRAFRISIARERVDSKNPFLRIKTTFRSVYDAGRREAEDRGLDELIYVNERDELTEGTITNVFLRLDGRWFTPPVASGLLPGIGREREMASLSASSDHALSREDLRRAEQILLTNAVRGTISAVFTDL